MRENIIWIFNHLCIHTKSCIIIHSYNSGILINYELLLITLVFLTVLLNNYENAPCLY